MNTQTLNVLEAPWNETGETYFECDCCYNEYSTNEDHLEVGIRVFCKDCISDLTALRIDGYIIQKRITNKLK